MLHQLADTQTRTHTYTRQLRWRHGNCTSVCDSEYEFEYLAHFLLIASAGTIRMSAIIHELDVRQKVAKKWKEGKSMSKIYISVISDNDLNKITRAVV